MTKTDWTAEEVLQYIEQIGKVTSPRGLMYLRAFAKRIEEDESAVPIYQRKQDGNWQDLSKDQYNRVHDCPLTTTRVLFTHPPAQEAQEQPIPMVLHCPSCGLQHIDKPEGQFYPGHTADESMAANKSFGLWDNPPHRSHLCHGCGTIWRPADVATTGVSSIQTKGKADTMKAAQEQPGWKWVPVEPTEEMIDKGTDEHQCEQGDPYYSAPFLSEGGAIAIYKAMIAAAPAPPKEK